MWSPKFNFLFHSSAHRPRSPRQNSMGGASTGSSSLPSPQTGTAPVETAATPTSASSPTAASPAPNMVASPSGDGKLKVNPSLILIEGIRCGSVGSVNIRSAVHKSMLCFYAQSKPTIFLFYIAKECRVQETRQTSPTANKENIKPLDSSPSITRPVCKGTVYTGQFSLQKTLLRASVCCKDFEQETICWGVFINLAVFVISFRLLCCLEK